MSKDIIILGIQWCGKWTQSKLLIDKLPNHLYFEMWQTLRALTSNDNLIWNYIADIIDHGNMVDVSVVYYLTDLAFRIANLESKFIIIDWFPRELVQAEFINSVMQNQWRDFVVVNMQLSKEKSMERMLLRAKEQWRKDDDPDVMQHRINLFYKNTIPVLEYFKNKWKLIEIDADDSIKNVHDNLIEKLGL
jgi:adenylate kinase